MKKLILSATADNFRKLEAFLNKASFKISARLGTYLEQRDILGCYGSIREYRIFSTTSFSFALSEEGEDYYVRGVYAGHASNIIGQYGVSDFWEDTCPPKVPTEIFVDGCYTVDGKHGIIVVRGKLAEVLTRHHLRREDYYYTLG